MPLENFGSILNFAEELENQDQAFYRAAAANPTCTEFIELFERFAADAAKNVKTVQRTRRENVTEMILEPIRDFRREPFMVHYDDVDSMSPEQVLAAAKRLEERAERYYTEAAEKIKALPEVARALKSIGKKRRAHLESLAAL